MYSSIPTARPAITPPARLQLQAQAKLRLKELGLEEGHVLAEYRFATRRYIEEKLGWSPWTGSEGAPGQQEIIDAYELALRQQEERKLAEAEQPYDAGIWSPGQTIQNRIRIEAGHTVGKTKTLAALVNHFFDCFPPAIIYTFAPTWEQIHDLLWKEVKADRRDKGLPGRILDLELRVADDHFAKGKATNNAGGQGTERAQGQHGPYLMFVLDEAEGIADYVFNAIDSMASGGVAIVLIAANPRTRTSRFHKLAGKANVKNFRISCINHPNVVHNRELIPGAVRRDYVLTMVEDHCEEVREHDPDAHTFELPWEPGRVLRPDPEFLFRVLGVAPANVAVDTFIPFGRYEAAVARGRGAVPEPSAELTVGIDAARFGDDMGNLYLEHGGVVWRETQFPQLDTTIYYQRTKQAALHLKAQAQAAGYEITSFHVRVDGGGGFGGGVIDQLRRDLYLMRAFADFQVFEVHNNGEARDQKAFADFGTEMYASAAARLQALAIRRPPDALEIDLTERRYEFVTNHGISVKRLVSKDRFRKDYDRSPDDGDGFVLATAARHLFRRVVPARPQSYSFGL